MQKKSWISFVITLVAALTMVVIMTAAAFAGEDETNEYVGFKIGDKYYVEATLNEGETVTVSCSDSIYGMEGFERGNPDADILSLITEPGNNRTFKIKGEKQGTDTVTVGYLLEPKGDAKRTVVLTVHVCKKYFFWFNPEKTLESKNRTLVEEGLKDYFREQNYTFTDVYVEYMEGDGAFPVTCWVENELTYKDIQGENGALEHAYTSASRKKPENLIGIGRQMISNKKSEKRLRFEQQDETKLEDRSEVFYTIMAEMPRDIEVTVEAPKCGEKIAYEMGLPTGSQPQVKDTDRFSVYTYDGKTYNEWYALNDGQKGDRLKDGDVIEGDKEYVAYAALKPNFGYYFDEVTAKTATVNGEMPLDAGIANEEDVLEVYGAVKAVHDWDEGEIVEEPTQTKEGSKIYKCRGCGAERTEVISKLPFKVNCDWLKHGYVEVDNEDVVAGEKVDVNVWGRHGYVYKEGTLKVIAASGEDVPVDGTSFIMPESDVNLEADFEPNHEHDLHPYSVRPTCTEEGTGPIWVCYTCDTFFADGEGKKEVHPDEYVLPPLGHDPESEVYDRVLKHPDCTHSGYGVKTVYCERCEKLVTEDYYEIPANGHSWGEWTVQKEATEDEDGEEIRRCYTDMNHYETRAIPKLGHDHVLSLVSEKPADCTKSGQRAYYACSGCGAIFEDAEGKVQTSEDALRIPATGHTPAEQPEKGEETPATCSTVGGYNLTTKCSDCGAVLRVERVITDVDENAHTWDEGSVVESPTDKREGEMKYTCSECGETKTEKIPKLEEDEYSVIINTRVENSSNDNGGYVTGSSGKIKEGESFTLTAKPRKGYDFLYWMMGGKKVSTDASYKFEVFDADKSGEVAVEAVFGVKVSAAPSVGGLMLNVGETFDLGEKIYPSGTMPAGMTWKSSDTKIAKVDREGVVTAVAAGKAEIIGKDADRIVTVQYTANVTDLSAGTSHKVNGSTYKILSKSTVSLTKAKNVKTVTVPATVKIGGNTFKVTKIGAKAFSKSKATKMIVKTKKLTKKSVKSSLKGSKIRTVKVSLGKKALNKKYVKKYKAYFTYKNAGKKVTVE